MNFRNIWTVDLALNTGYLRGYQVELYQNAREIAILNTNFSFFLWRNKGTQLAVDMESGILNQCEDPCLSKFKQQQILAQFW